MSTIDTQEIRDLGQGETIVFSCCFGGALNGATIATVESITQHSGPGTLAIGTSTINDSSAVSVDGISQRQGTVAQVDITAQTPSGAGDTAKAIAGVYRVDVLINSSASPERIKMRCWIRVTA